MKSQSRVNFLEGNISVMKATGFFGRNIENVKPGLEFGYLRQTKNNSPLFWGISLYYHLLGTSGSYRITEQLDFNLVDFDYDTDSHMIGINGKMRFYPQLNIRNTEVYAEALIGYKWLYTSTSKTLATDSESSDTNIEKGSLSLTYGVAAGLNIHLKNDLYLNLRGSYLPGLSVPYYVLTETGSQVNASTIELFQLKKSTTDMFRWDVGITWRFFTGNN